MISFDERTDEERKTDKKYFDKVRNIANNLIVYAFHENHSDTDEAIRLINSLSKPQASAHNKEVPIRFIKNDLPSLMKLAKDMDEPQSPNSDYEATPKVCPECKGLGLCSYKDSGDSVYWQRRCKTCKGTGKPIS